jgi:hypothetical protein
VLTTTNGTPRVVGTLVLSMPVQVDRNGLANVVAHVLDDIQDLVITHLATPWLLTESGKTTHPSAELVGTELILRFLPRDSFRAEYGDAPRALLAPVEQEVWPVSLAVAANFWVHRDRVVGWLRAFRGTRSSRRRDPAGQQGVQDRLRVEAFAIPVRGEGGAVDPQPGPGVHLDQTLGVAGQRGRGGRERVPSGRRNSHRPASRRIR